MIWSVNTWAYSYITDRYQIDILAARGRLLSQAVIHSHIHMLNEDIGTVIMSVTRKDANRKTTGHMEGLVFVQQSTSLST